MEPEIEAVKVNCEVAMKTVFSEKEARAGHFAAVLETMNESMPLGWQDKVTVICRRLWARKGAFAASSETFVDAFDHTVTKEIIWKFSKEKGPGAVSGLELHGWGARPDPASESSLIPLETIGDLKRLLSTVPADTFLFSPSGNFELKGNLKKEIDLFCIQDMEGREWAMLRADSRAGMREREAPSPEEIEKLFHFLLSETESDPF